MSVQAWALIWIVLLAGLGYALAEKSAKPTDGKRVLGLLGGFVAGFVASMLTYLPIMGDGAGEHWPEAVVERTEDKVDISFPSGSRPEIDPENPQALIDKVLSAKGLSKVGRPADRGTWYWEWTWEDYSSSGESGVLHAAYETCEGMTGKYPCLEAIQFDKHTGSDQSEKEVAKEDETSPEEEGGGYGEDGQLTKAECRQDLQCWAKENRIDAGVACQDAIEDRAKYDYKWIDTWGADPSFARVRWESKEKGSIIYFGDGVKFQNGLGNWMRMTYNCTYNPEQGVQEVQVTEGRLD